MHHLDSLSIRSSCSGWYAIDLFSWFSTWLPGGHWMPPWNRLSAYSYSAGVRMDFIHLFRVWAPWKISWPLLPARGHFHACRFQEGSINQSGPEVSVNGVIWKVQLSSSCPTLGNHRFTSQHDQVLASASLDGRRCHSDACAKNTYEISCSSPDLGESMARAWARG